MYLGCVTLMLCCIALGVSLGLFHVHTSQVMTFHFYYSAGIHHVSSVLEQSTSSLTRRTGLGEKEVWGLLLEVSRAVLATTSPSNVMNLYTAGLTQYHWGELHVL